MAALTTKQIAGLEAKGFKRWTKGDMDRLYVDMDALGLNLSRYKSGNVSRAEWCGEKVSNAEGGRINDSKVYVDVATGELVVQDRSKIAWEYFDAPSIEDKARELYDEVMAEQTEQDSVENGSEQEETKMANEHMSVREAVENGVSEDGWYEMGAMDVYVEDGVVKRATVPDGLGRRTVAFYRHSPYEASEWVRADDATLADVLSGSVTHN